MNRSVQKQLEIMMKCEDLLTEALTDEKKQCFLDYVDAWHEWGSESNLDSLLDDFLCNKLPGSDQPRRDDEVYSVVDALQ